MEAIDKLKQSISILEENDTYSKEIGLSIFKANVLMDMSMASARHKNTYNRTEYLRQAESILQDISTNNNTTNNDDTTTNNKWIQTISVYKAAIWYELGLYFSEANISLALKYSIKHNQNVLYRRGAPVCWNSAAKGCCMIGALISEFDRALAAKCFAKAAEAARIANNDALAELVSPFVAEGQQQQRETPLHKPESSESSSCRGFHTSKSDSRTVSGIFGSESNDDIDDDEDDDEEENWDMEFGIETNMEHFSLNDSMKSTTVNVLRSQPNLPSQYKLSERLLKPMPNVTNYLRTTHLYSLKTPDGHSSIPEQKFCEWLRTLIKTQYEEQHDGHMPMSTQTALENHNKRLKDKIVIIIT